MRFRGKNLTIDAGYCIRQDRDYTLEICAFRRRSAPEGEIKFHFSLFIAFALPRFLRAYGCSEYSDCLGAINSALWTGRHYEIRGWDWPVLASVIIGRRLWSLPPMGRKWSPPWLKRRAEIAMQRQKRLNSAVTLARMQDPRAPDWLIRARALNIAGL